MNKTGRVFCTVITKNYLAYARTLFNSLRQFHADVPMIALLVDRADNYFDPKKELFEIIHLDELNIPNIASQCFQYDAFPLSASLKSHLLRHLLFQKSYRRVIYLDADVCVYDNLEPLFNTLDTANGLLTPHICDGSAKPPEASELEVLKHGIYNTGFMGLSNSETTRKFLSWWISKLSIGCLALPHAGIYVEQRWIDLAVAIFDQFLIIHDAGCNLGHWNLRGIRFSKNNNQYYANESRLRFFHFSGFDIDHPERISRHNPELSTAGNSALLELYADYSERLKNNGFLTCSKWPYIFDFFEDGTKITIEMRRIYATLLNSQHLPNPFSKELHDYIVTAGNSMALDSADKSLEWEQRCQKLTASLFLGHIPETHGFGMSKDRKNYFGSEVVSLLDGADSQIKKLRHEVGELRHKVVEANTKLDRFRKIPGYLWLSRLLKQFGI